MSERATTALSVPLVVDAVDAIDDALDDARLAAELGATMIEWRVDPLAAEPAESAAAAVHRLLRDGPLPSILTCRDPEEGGAADVDDDERAALLTAVADAIEAGPHRPTYVDVEVAAFERHGGLRAAALRLRRDETRLILSSHAFSGRPSDLYQRLERAAAIDACDVVKLAWFARSIRDVAEAAELLALRPKPMIVLCMGPFGVASRVLAGRFGGVLTFASLGDGHSTAPGQPTLAAMRSLYRADHVGPATETYGIIGWPLEHTASPAVHNAAFTELGRDAVYLTLPIPAEWEHAAASLTTWVDDERLGLRGLSVTIPHKEHAVRFVRERGGAVAPIAALLGAANTVCIAADRALACLNTDAPAIVDALGEALAGRPPQSARVAGGAPAPDATAVGTPSLADLERPDSAAADAVAGRRVLVLGAGGAARAAAGILAWCGATVFVSGRTAERAEAIARDLAAQPDRHGAAMSVAAIPWSPDAMANAAADLIVQATPVGMVGGPDPDGDPLPASVVLGLDHVVLETVYAPIETPFVRRARDAGAIVVTGDRMFALQADRQCRAWTGRELPVEARQLAPGFRADHG